MAKTQPAVPVVAPLAQLKLLTLLTLLALIALALAPARSASTTTTIAPTFHGPVSAPVTIQISADRHTEVDAETRVQR